MLYDLVRRGEVGEVVHIYQQELNLVTEWSAKFMPESSVKRDGSSTRTVESETRLQFKFVSRTLEDEEGAPFVHYNRTK